MLPGLWMHRWNPPGCGRRPRTSFGRPVFLLCAADRISSREKIDVLEGPRSTQPIAGRQSVAIAQSAGVLRAQLNRRVGIDQANPRPMAENAAMVRKAARK